jgi:hypothetical protein
VITKTWSRSPADATTGRPVAWPAARHVAVGDQPDLAGPWLKPYLVDTVKLSTDLQFIDKVRMWLGWPPVAQARHAPLGGRPDHIKRDLGVGLRA